MPGFEALRTPNRDIIRVVEHGINPVARWVFRGAAQKLVEYLVCSITIRTDLQVVSDVRLVEPLHLCLLSFRSYQKFGDRFEVAVRQACLDVNSFVGVFCVKHGAVFIE